VNTCTPIEIGGILVRQKEGFHPASKNSRIQEFKKFRRRKPAAAETGY
jgi:hypothetical protein